MRNPSGELIVTFYILRVPLICQSPVVQSRRMETYSTWVSKRWFRYDFPRERLEQSPLCPMKTWCICNLKKQWPALPKSLTKSHINKAKQEDTSISQPYTLPHRRFLKQVRDESQSRSKNGRESCVAETRCRCTAHRLGEVNKETT